MPTDLSTIGNAVGEVNTQFSLTGDELKKTSEDMIKFAEINGSDVTNATIQSKQALEAYYLICRSFIGCFLTLQILCGSRNRGFSRRSDEESH